MGEGANGSSKKGATFLGSSPKKSPSLPWRGDRIQSTWLNSFSTFCFSARRARHFAIQSIAEKSCFANSPHVGCCNKLKKCLIVIRVYVAILGLGTSSGPSGDFHLTRPAQGSRKLFPERLLLASPA